MFTSMAAAMLVAKATLNIGAIVKKDGSVQVSRVLQDNITGEYSEVQVYVPKLEGSELIEVEVGDEKVSHYTQEKYGWRDDFTAEQSKNRYGITSTSDGYLVHWGMGDTGLRTYKMRYEVTNIVGTYADCDALDFIFFGGGVLTQNDVKLIIGSPIIGLTEEETPVILCGFSGDVAYEEGNVIITPTSQGEGISHVKVMFPKGTFNTQYERTEAFAFAPSRVAQMIPVGKKSVLYSVKLDVNLLKNGDARVTEIRQMIAGTKGTEGYITFNNMGSRKLKDFTVSDDITGEFVTESSWNVERTRNDKEGRCGIYSTSDGEELCWGLGQPGLHTYVLNYTITDLVRAYKDFDGFNHSFYEAAEPAAYEAEVRIHCEMDSLKAKENARVWTFGHKGEVAFEDGAVVARSSRDFKSGEGVIVMMQFSKGLFTPQTSYSDSFVEAVKKVAFEGSDYDLVDEGEGGMASLAGGEYKEPLTWSDIGLGGLCCMLCVGLFTWPFVHSKRKRNKQYNRLLGTKDLKQVQYYQRVPLNGNLLKSRIIKSSVTGSSREEKGLIEAFILRLVYSNKVSIVQDRNSNGDWVQLLKIAPPQKPDGTDTSLSTLSYEYKSFYYAGNRMPMSDECVMYCLHEILYESAGEDHLLQPNELKNYVKDEDRVIALRPFAKALQDVAQDSVSLNNIDSEDAKQVMGFWRYLNDLTLVSERSMQEVTLWKDFLVFASAFDIAEQVRRDMKKICPDYTALDQLTRSLLDNDMTSAICSSLSNMMLSQVHYARDYETAAEREARIKRERQYSRSSGGGGSSSYGGGGGHSGGGGSGVR